MLQNQGNNRDIAFLFLILKAQNIPSAVFAIDFIVLNNKTPSRSVDGQKI